MKSVAISLAFAARDRKIRGSDKSDEVFGGAWNLLLSLGAVQTARSVPWIELSAFFPPDKPVIFEHTGSRA
jgi:hypothetical protein